VQLRLVTGEGVRGIYIGKSSIMGSEEEVLLPENTRYAIHSVAVDPKTGKYIVEAVVLPTVEGKLE
jgi:ADP-ribosyltransferase exoenzyme